MAARLWYPKIDPGTYSLYTAAAAISFLLAEAYSSIEIARVVSCSTNLISISTSTSSGAAAGRYGNEAHRIFSAPILHLQQALLLADPMPTSKEMLDAAAASSNARDSVSRADSCALPYLISDTSMRGVCLQEESARAT